MGDTPYLTHSSETWGVDCEWIGKCWSRCIGTILLYHALYIAHKKTPRSWGQVEANVGSTKPRHDETRRANIERISYSNTYHANGPELVQAHLNVFTSPRITPSAPGQHLFATVPMEQHLGQQVNRLITLDRIAWNHQTDVLVITKNGKTCTSRKYRGILLPMARYDTDAFSPIQCAAGHRHNAVRFTWYFIQHFNYKIKTRYGFSVDKSHSIFRPSCEPRGVCCEDRGKFDRITAEPSRALVRSWLRRQMAAIFFVTGLTVSSLAAIYRLMRRYYIFYIPSG